MCHSMRSFASGKYAPEFVFLKTSGKAVGEFVVINRFLATCVRARAGNFAEEVGVEALVGVPGFFLQAFFFPGVNFECDGGGHGGM